MGDQQIKETSKNYFSTEQNWAKRRLQNIERRMAGQGGWL